MSVKSLLYCGLASLLAACGSGDPTFRLEGRFRNLNQGEFYLYSAEQGWKDTIAVRDGRFTYSRTVKDTTVLTLVFPNYSELPIVAQPGVKAQVDGDASHLRATRVKGSRDNEDLTNFRLHANQLTPPEVLQSAEQFVTDHPASLASVWLLQRYFVITASPDYEKAQALCRTILAARPDDGSLVRLEKQLGVLAGAGVGDTLPAFKASDTDGREVTELQLRKSVNVVLAWASWANESRAILRKVSELHKHHPGKIGVVSVSLDASPAEGRTLLQRDSIAWPNICDGQMWQSPLVGLFGFGFLPANIIADEKGNILARDIANAKAMETELEKLLD